MYMYVRDVDLEFHRNSTAIWNSTEIWNSEVSSMKIQAYLSTSGIPNPLLLQWHYSTFNAKKTWSGIGTRNSMDLVAFYTFTTVVYSENMLDCYMCTYLCGTLSCLTHYS